MVSRMPMKGVWWKSIVGDVEWEMRYEFGKERGSGERESVCLIIIKKNLNF